MNRAVEAAQLTWADWTSVVGAHVHIDDDDDDNEHSSAEGGEGLNI